MPRVALPDSYSYAGYLGVSTLHTFKINIISPVSSLTTSSCDVPFKILLGILGYWTSLIWGLFEVSTPTRPPWGRPCQPHCSYARRYGCLYTPFDQDHDSDLFSSLSIKPVMLPTSMLGDYSTSASSTPTCFPCRIDLLGNLFLITSLLDLTFFSFLDHHTGHHPRHDARILLYECIFDALWIFSSSFRSIGSLLPIGCYSTSLRLARLQTGRLLSWFVLFSSRPTLWQSAQENTVLSPKTDPLWPLSNSKVSFCR
jgi:hypothetical protein